mmetsp:Transcript_38404/g.81859  ORF Transcript_38404/g.81859 Transcript_38404/m.81859 type:complete len:285 (+) Transcript_38404:428-1282(+)
MIEAPPEHQLGHLLHVRVGQHCDGPAHGRRDGTRKALLDGLFPLARVERHLAPGDATTTSRLDIEKVELGEDAHEAAVGGDGCACLALVDEQLGGLAQRHLGREHQRLGDGRHELADSRARLAGLDVADIDLRHNLERLDDLVALIGVGGSQLGEGEVRLPLLGLGEADDHIATITAVEMLSLTGPVDLFDCADKSASNEPLSLVARNVEELGLALRSADLDLIAEFKTLDLQRHHARVLSTRAVCMLLLPAPRVPPGRVLRGAEAKAEAEAQRADVQQLQHFL